jgi:hypothetical protein
MGIGPSIVEKSCSSTKVYDLRLLDSDVYAGMSIAWLGV